MLIWKFADEDDPTQRIVEVRPKKKESRGPGSYEYIRGFKIQISAAPHMLQINRESRDALMHRYIAPFSKKIDIKPSCLSLDHLRVSLKKDLLFINDQHTTHRSWRLMPPLQNTLLSMLRVLFDGLTVYSDKIRGIILDCETFHLVDPRESTLFNHGPSLKAALPNLENIFTIQASDFDYIPKTCRIVGLSDHTIFPCRKSGHCLHQFRAREYNFDESAQAWIGPQSGSWTTSCFDCGPQLQFRHGDRVLTREELYAIVDPEERTDPERIRAAQKRERARRQEKRMKRWRRRFLS